MSAQLGAFFKVASQYDFLSVRWNWSKCNCIFFGLTTNFKCYVLLLVPKYFLPVQTLWASLKNWQNLVPLQKLLCRHKNQFYWLQIIFFSGTKCLWLLQYVNTFLVWHKKFGQAQNILGPVKGQGIRELRENLKHKIQTFEGCLLWSGLGIGWLPVIWWSTPKRE